MTDKVKADWINAGGTEDSMHCLKDDLKCPKEKDRAYGRVDHKVSLSKQGNVTT